MKGKLYLVATPIGNLADLSQRAIETMKSVDVIACEDTRHTRKLLNHFGISARLVSYHEYNESSRSDELIDRLGRGESVALVSDAGTPAISDPGLKLVQRAIEGGYDVVPIPGATAFVAAAIVSGLPTDALFFGGFLPARSGERQRRLEEVASVPATLVFYEAPHRLGASLADCGAKLGPRRCCIVRELTKLHEEVIRGDLTELAERFREVQLKGEIILVIDRGEAHPTAQSGLDLSISARVSNLESSGLDRRDALKRAAKEMGLSRSEAYRRLQNEKKL